MVCMGYVCVQLRFSLLFVWLALLVVALGIAVAVCRAGGCAVALVVRSGLRSYDGVGAAVEHV